MQRLAITLLTLVLTAAGLAGCSNATTDVGVYFVHGVMVESVTRTVSGDAAEGALQQLLEGPTSEEAEYGLFSEVPEGTQLLSYELSDDGERATVDLSAEFAERGNDDDVDETREVRGGIAQVVFTIAGIEDVLEVDILVEGSPFVTEGVASLTTPSDEKHETGVHESEEEAHEEENAQADIADVDEVQEELIRLGYLPSDGATGEYDYQTKMAVMAFQGWEGIDKDGDVGPQTTEALKAASAPAPEPIDESGGRVAQVFREKGVALLIEDGELVRAVHTSTGRSGKETPAGKFEVYQMEESHWSHAYNVELPYCSFFHGGYAFHEYPEVPPYPASHGCARLPSPEAPRVYDFVEIGTPVYVY
jgi:hypothetical protein